MMFEDINPEDYVHMMNLKESMFTTYYEVEERKFMEKDGFSNMRLIYVNNQSHFHKDDLAKYDLSDERILQVIELVKQRSEAFLKFSEAELDFSNMSWDELMQIFDKFRKVWGGCMRVIDVPVYILNYFEPKTVALMKEKGYSEKEFDVLTHPLYKTYHQRRHRDLFEVKKGNMSRDEFKKKWAFSQMVVFQYKPVDDKFIDEQLEHVKDADKELKELNEKQEKGEKAYNELYETLPDELKKKADLIQKFIYIRDYRFELAIRAIFNLQPFLRELASRLNITYDQLIYLTPEEVVSKKIPEKLQMRMEKFVYYDKYIYVGENADKIYNMFNKRMELDELTGKGVSSGKVTGTAKVVLSPNQLSKIKKGDIIVTELTTPDYLHALSKVSAIVTNIGGFTSHSAIVAREFGIPCVVGTNNATNVFKDGDKLEVDATKGIVRKIR